MSASSLSVAAAAVGTCSNCFSSSLPSIDHHLSLYLFPYKPKPIKNIPKIKNFHKCSPISPISRSSIYCASTAFDSVELNEEEDSYSGVEEPVSENEEGENDVSQSARGRRLYVGHLPLSTTSDQLSEIFAKAGRVDSVEVRCDRVSGGSRSFAFITMGTVEEAKEAIRLFDGAQIGGLTAKVNFPEVPRRVDMEVMSYQSFVDSPFKICARNLSWGLTSQGLTKAFAQQPGFLSAKVIYDRDSGKSRGFGFVSFSSAEEVESALIAMNGSEVEGRPLRLELAKQHGADSPLPFCVELNKEEDVQSAGGRRLFVGHLPVQMTSTQLSEIFAKAGRVDSVEMPCDRISGRSRGFAFITMGTVEEAKEAIRLFDGAQIGGLTAKVNFPEVPRRVDMEVMGYQGFVDSPFKIYACNLSWGLTSQGLTKAFAQQPGFVSAKVIYDRYSGKSRGFGFVSFSSAEEVESALSAMNGLEVEGRPLLLALAKQNGADSPRRNDLENNEMFSSTSA